MPRRLRFPVRERIDAQGRVLVPLDEAGVAALAERLMAERIEAVAVGFLHSFTNPAHERRAGEILAEHLPGVPITLSSEVSPEMREYERFSTACANAYVQPQIGHYLANLETLLRREGFACPLFLMLSGGGLTAVETAIRFPVRLVESGPAGGAIFAAEIARQCRLDKVFSYDMGGTTAKICLIDDLKPQTNRSFEVARIYRFKKGSGLPLRIPVIEMVEIGAGGGSVARIDRLKRITVGPDSAGADPGPACYGQRRDGADRDRRRPRARPHRPLRVFRRPHGARRRRPRRRRCAAKWPSRWSSRSSSPHSASARSSTRTWPMPLACMRSRAARTPAAAPSSPLAARPRCTRRGLRKNWASTECWCRPMPGSARRWAFCARRSPTRSCAPDCSASTRSIPAAANALLAAMRGEAEAVVRRGAPDARLTETRSAFMRYRGQGHEIAVPLPTKPYAAADAATLRAAFEDAYRRLYSRIIPGVDVELLSWVLLLSAPPPAEPAAARPLPAPYTPEPARLPPGL